MGNKISQHWFSLVSLAIVGVVYNPTDSTSTTRSGRLRAITSTRTHDCRLEAIIRLTGSGERDRIEAQNEECHNKKQEMKSNF